MKFIFSILMIITHFIGYSQRDSLSSPFQAIDTFQTEIHLSNTIDSLNCGIWQNGDYTISIELQSISRYLDSEYSGLIRAMENEPSKDSEMSRLFIWSAERYLNGIKQLKDAKNLFDLRQLVLYVGRENVEYNKGNSTIVEEFVKQSLEKGNAVVFYKGKRVFKLNKRIVRDYVMSTIKIYFDDERNCAFSYFGYINW